MGEVDDLRDELADSEARLARMPSPEECQCAGAHEALSLTEERQELVQRIEALSGRIERLRAEVRPGA